MLDACVWWSRCPSVAPSVRGFRDGWMGLTWIESHRVQGIGLPSGTHPVGAGACRGGSQQLSAPQALCGTRTPCLPCDPQPHVSDGTDQAARATAMMDMFLVCGRAEHYVKMFSPCCRGCRCSGGDRDDQGY